MKKIKINKIKNHHKFQKFKKVQKILIKTNLYRLNKIDKLIQKA